MTRKRWIPREGERYYCIIHDEITFSRRDYDSPKSCDFLYRYNTFRTKADATRAMKRIQKILREGSKSNGK